MSEDAVIRNAKLHASRLIEIGHEFDLKRREAESLGRTVQAELDALDGDACRCAAELLAKLGTEVIRLRLSIGHYEYGHMTRDALIRVPRTWNADPAQPDQKASS